MDRKIEVLTPRAATSFVLYRDMNASSYLVVLFSPPLCACVCVLGGDVMHYGVYVSKVVCNFSPCHWALPAYSWKRHLASCAAAGWSLTDSVAESNLTLVDTACVCLFVCYVWLSMPVCAGLVKLVVLKVQGSSIYQEAKWQVQRLQLNASFNYYYWGWRNDN